MVCLSVCLTTVGPAETDEPIEMPFGSWTRVGSGNNTLDWGSDPPREEAVLGMFPPFNCIRLCMQLTPVAARDYRFVRFRMDSSAAGVTSAGAMRPVVKILWPLVITPIFTLQICGHDGIALLCCAGR